MELPSDQLKSFTERMARLVASDQGKQVIQHLRLTGLLTQPSVAAQEGGPAGVDRAAFRDPATITRAGIWERQSKAGQTVFLRRMDMQKEWKWWANVGRINPKGSKRRVVLLGESVARGFLYDPAFNPAMALETMLRSRMGKDQVEVIDLARTNLRLEGLLELARSAMALEPDAIVIFAGNNWVCTPNGVEDLRTIAASLRESGVPALKQFAEDWLTRAVAGLMDSVAALCRARSIPLVWMVPEFNLGDWLDPQPSPPHLAQGVLRQWIDCWEQAQSALQEGDFKRAADLANTMIELDEGVTASGWYILAQVHLKAGDVELARRELESARDAVIWDSFTSRSVSPRAFSVVQQALRAGAIKHGNALVDLPIIFKEKLNGELPDRRLFLDYCHLTSEGMRVAMGAAAASLLPLLGRTQPGWNQMANDCNGPPSRVDAEAYFLAAIHNAHWWQRYDLVHHYCSSALQMDPELALPVRLYIDLQSQRAPMLMCQAAEHLTTFGSLLIQHYLFHSNDGLLDELLLNVAVDSLQGLGINVHDQLAQLRREQHSVAYRDINLLEYYYLTSALQPLELKWALPPRAGSAFRRVSDYYKAYWQESRFVFVGEAGRRVLLSLACRLPVDGKSETTVIEVNGTLLGEMSVGQRWQTWDVLASEDIVRDGINQVIIRWPTPDYSAEQSLERAATELIDEKAFPELFPVFGEIHSFIASDGGNRLSQ